MIRDNKIKNRVLVVDDNAKNIQILATHLQDDNYEVEYASSGKKAVIMVEKEEFDLILLDVMMPGIDGFETCKRIKAIENRKHIPIIFVTAKSDIDSLTLGFEYGGVDYITKPFKADELLLRVSTHVELKKARDLLNYHKTYLEKKESGFIDEINSQLYLLKKQKSDYESVIEAQSDIIRLFIETYNQSLDKISTPVSLLKLQDMSKKATELVDQINNYLNSGSKTGLFILKHQDVFIKRENALRKINFSPERLIANSLNELATGLRSKNIKINADFKNKVSINGDISLFQDIIKAVLTNSCDNSPDNSQIDIIIEDGPQASTITIKDQGPGFPKNYILYPFKPVKKADNKNYSLNLFFAKFICKLHNFDLKIGNNPDKGAFVKISIPK